MRLTKIGFSIERFTADFSQSSSTTVKTCLLYGLFSSLNFGIIILIVDLIC